jgi:hypothetical protein
MRASRTGIDEALDEERVIRSFALQAKFLDVAQLVDLFLRDLDVHKLLPLLGRSNG